MPTHTNTNTITHLFTMTRKQREFGFAERNIRNGTKCKNLFLFWLWKTKSVLWLFFYFPPFFFVFCLSCFWWLCMLLPCHLFFNVHKLFFLDFFFISLQIPSWHFKQSFFACFFFSVDIFFSLPTSRMEGGGESLDRFFSRSESTRRASRGWAQKFYQCHWCTMTWTLK